MSQATDRLVRHADVFKADRLHGVDGARQADETDPDSHGPSPFRQRTNLAEAPAAYRRSDVDLGQRRAGALALDELNQGLDRIE